ncbi:UMTA methyltransferase family protein [Pyronema domesticum]|nr:UMTA methyltransferase family protein [Pyronema domesticum]
MASTTQPESQYENSATHIEPESEYDSSYFSNSSAGSTTASLSSAILDYVYENGRRYHAYREGVYVLPNDESEQDRLDLVHHIMLMLLSGKLLVAPVDTPQKILDLGTGTGIWAVDAADEYPSAEVIGNDLSPIQPGWVPPNCKFEVDDFEADWPHPHDTFDVVHARTLSGSVKDWPKLHEQAFKALKSGGILEVQEPAVWAWSDDGTLKDDSYYMQMQRLTEEASVKMGRRFNTAADQKQWMIDAGFVDVQEKIYILPFGPWPKNKKLKQIGFMQKQQLQDALEPYCLALFTRVLDWSNEQVADFLAKVREEIQSGKQHSYTKAYFVYGRKP